MENAVERHHATPVTREWVEQGLAVHRELAETVSRKKYQHSGEESFDDVMERVAKHAKDEPSLWMLLRKRFIPAGSILSGLGNTEYACSLSNCYLTKIENDSIEAIFDAVKKLARTYSYRGGSGVDITVLRPKGYAVNNAAITSSGAVSFMPMFSEVTNTIGQQGRRGALLISMDVTHPDILDFIWCKARPEEVFGKDPLTGKLPDVFGANISVKIPDAFMEAVAADAEWTFKFPDRKSDPAKYEREWDGDYEAWTASGGELIEYGSMPAREILRQISEAAWASGDPGTMFITTAQEMAPGTFVDAKALKPMSSNPCGEESMAFWNSCLLGALVLHRYVENPWTADACFNKDLFIEDVKRAVVFMNTMSDLNEDLHPLPEQREADKYGKRIGIEFTGLGDMLAMLGLRYGSKEAIAFTENIMRDKAIAEIEASVELAREQGPCPALEPEDARERFLQSPYIVRLGLPVYLKEDFLRYGACNTAFNTVGPCGSISIMGGNCTSGIEPVYKVAYRRDTRLSDKTFDLVHQPILEHLATLSDDELAGYTVETLKDRFCYVESHDLNWRDRIAMQAAVQKYTDASISSTINLPETATVEEIEQIYLEAWKAGLKGVTIFRDGSKKGVLSGAKPDNVIPFQAPAPGSFYVKELLDKERADRYRVKWFNAKMYVIVSLDDDDMPVEIFVKLPKEAGYDKDGIYTDTIYREKFSQWETITRLASLLLRAGMPLGKIIKQLDKASYSLTDAPAVIARILRKYQFDPDLDDYNDEEIVEHGLGLPCPACGVKAYVPEGGCPTCKACGYSNCG